MYSIPKYISKPVGNNAFSYDKRITLWSVGKLYVPSLIKWTISDLELWWEICFEEIVNEKLVSCSGLKHFLQTTFYDTPIYIVDNHNHVLSFRLEHTKTLNSQQSKISTLNILHIDQHSDIKPCSAKCRIQNSEISIKNFVNEKTNVGNFITAAINSWIINEVIQIRTDYAFQNFQLSTLNSQPFILDIDMDFRQEKDNYTKDFEIIRTLMKKARMVTIATSPYFLDQNNAIDLIQKLFAE